MKRLVILFGILICTICCADTINIKWFNEGVSEYTTTTCQIGDDIILPNTPTKRGHTFAGWKKAEYIPIEYIEGIGGGLQSIDTGIYGTLYSHISVKVSTISAGSGDGIVCGYRSIGLTTIGVNYFYLSLALYYMILCLY